ncbi:MAG: hypothetical protein LIO96_05120, partial [Lachnospiraceae bacterium]|nr:hypothetical protein [Lachnospiraceae bacterium]
EYHLVPQKFFDKLNLTIYQEDSNYNAGADSRMSEMFDYVSPHEKDFLMYIERVSFAIIANLARCNLCVPTEEQMLKMLKIGEYTGEEMREYIHDDIEWRCSCISAKRLAPAVCLLARVLSEAMMDKSEWQGYRKGRKKKNYTPVPNQSMEKFNRLVAFMEENHLLYLDKSDEAEYERYVVKHARFLCRIVCIRGEMQVVYDAIKQRQKKFLEEIRRELEELYRKREKSSPPAAPADVPAPCDIAATLPHTGNRFSQKKIVNLRFPVNVPPEMSAIFARMKQFDDEAAALQEECWEQYDCLLEENSAEREQYVPEESVDAVAMGAFVAILSGDKLYKLKLGRMILEDMMSLSDMPLTGSFMAELEDEDEWDYLCPESNGSLALPVIKEG